MGSDIPSDTHNSPTSRAKPKEAELAKKLATAKKTQTTEKTLSTKTTLPPRPVTPEIKGAHKMGRKTGPEMDLHRAENTLARVIEVYKKQTEHQGNGGVDFGPFWDRLAGLEETYSEKGLLKSKRDLTYDWAGFCKEAQQIEDDLLEAVLENLKRKAGRMVWTADLNEEEAEEIWAEADEKDHVGGKIYGWSNAVRKLRAAGCYDPEEQQLRGGRQPGTNRRGRG